MEEIKKENESTQEIKEVKPEDYSDLVEHFFDEDLVIDDITIKSFTEEKQFNFEGLLHKARKAIDEKYQFTKESIYDKLSFETCKKISNWLNENTNICDKFGQGNVIDKTFKFLSIVSKYLDLKHNIKKK